MGIEIPEASARATVVWEGVAGCDWINALPHVIQRLFECWRLPVEGPVTHGFVGVVRTADYWLWALCEGFTEDTRLCCRLIEWLEPRSII